MPDERLHAYTYRVLRYTPNLVRDEWVNIGVVIQDPVGKDFRVRLVEELNEFARIRKLHPTADENLLRALRDDFQTQLDAHRDDVSGYIAQLDQTLSNILQLSPQKGVLAEDLDAELDRLYRDHVEPPRYRGIVAEAPNTPTGIRARLTQVFRSAGILSRMERRVSVAAFTFPGDPLRLDYSYRRNGTRGFIHALALSRDPGHAKELAFTAERIRAKLEKTEFAAVTEARPLPDNERHRFVVRLLEDQGIELVPLTGLAEFVNRLRPTIH
jgi:hypothetical protein